MVSTFRSFRAPFASISRLTGSALRVSAAFLMAIGLACCPHAAAATAQFVGVQITAASSLTAPSSVAVDTTGNIFVAAGAAVYEIPFSGGSYQAAVSIGNSTFVSANGVAVDSLGDVFVADSGATHIGVWELLSASFTSSPTQIGGAFIHPNGVAVDVGRNLFVADGGTAHGVFKIAFSGSTYAAASTSINTTFTNPQAVAVDSTENLFVSDGAAVSKLTFSGSSYSAPAALAPVLGGNPSGLALDGSGNLFVAVPTQNALDEIPSSGGLYNTFVTLSAGIYTGPKGVAVDAAGNLYLADTGGAAIDKIITSNASFGSINVGSASTQVLSALFAFEGAGSVTIGAPVVLTQGTTGLDFASASGGNCTAAAHTAGTTCHVNLSLTPTKPGVRPGAVELRDGSGNVLATGFVSGFGLGPAINFSPVAATSITVSGLTLPRGLAVDAGGNDLFVADSTAHKVFEVSGGTTYTVMNLTGTSGTPESVAVDGAGNVYAADSANGKILVVSPGATAHTFGTVTTFDSGLSAPRGVAVDGDGNVYFSDTGNHQILRRRFTPGGYTAAAAITTTTTLTSPYGIAVDGSGNLFIADFGGNQVVVKPTTGTETVISGLNGPTSVATDDNSNVYISDSGNKSILKVAPPYTGTPTTLADATTAGLSAPYGLAVDDSGNLAISDDAATAVVLEEAFSTESLSFTGSPVVGSIDTTTTTGQSIVTLQNFGNGSSALAGTISANPTDFQLTTSTCTSTTSFSLAGGGAGCQLTFEFIPQSPGTFTESFILTDNNLNTPGSTTQSISMTGTGVKADTLTSVSPSIAVPTVDETETFTATVTPAAPSTLGPAFSAAATMAFFDGGNPISGCGTEAVTVGTSQATATCQVLALTLGTHSITAVYSGDSNYNVTSAPTALSLTVGQAASTTTLTPSVTSSTVDQQVTFTATIAPNVTVSESPVADFRPIAGTVTFMDGVNPVAGTNCSGAAITYNAATGQATTTSSCSISTLTAGSHSITAVYTGNSDYKGSTSTPATQVSVAKAATALTLGTSNPSVPLNTSVTFTATVTPTGPVGLTGTVTFTDNGSPLACTVNWTPATGIATCATSTLTGGNHSIVATYNANNSDPNYLSSNNNVTESIGLAATNTSLSVVPNSSAVNQSVTITATVTPAGNAVALTGTVSFTDNGGPVAGCTVVFNKSTGIASCATSSLTVGTHPLQATYSGDSSYATSNGTNSHVVSPGTTSLNLSASPNPSAVNQSVTFTATITPTPAVPAGGIPLTGSVSFVDSVTALPIPNCSAVALASGQAKCATSTLSLGAHTITATYANDSNYGTSFNTVPQTVTAATTGLTLQSSQNPSVVDGPVVFQATITIPAGNTGLVGTVAYTDNNVTISGCAAVHPSTAGVANCSTSALTASGSPHTIKATYSNDPNFATTSASLSQIVNISPTNTTLLSSTNPSGVNQPVTFTATVAPAAGSDVVPFSGTITFTDGGNPITGCTTAVAVNTSTGVAQCNATALTAGTHIISAVYNTGDLNYSTSTSSNVSQVVSASVATTVLKSSSAVLDTSTVNDSVTFTESVTPPAGGIQPTGSVKFEDNGAVITSCGSAGVVQLASGTAACTTLTLTGGAHTILAIYSGDTNYSSVNTSLTQTVNKAASAITFAANPANTSTVNQPVTLTATVTPINASVKLSGSVTFADGANAVSGCAVTFNTSTGIATCTTSLLALGTHTITATYGNDGSYSNSSAPLTQVITQGGTSLALTSSSTLVNAGPPPTYSSTVNQSVTFTAVVSTSLAIPTGGTVLSGTVTFTDTTTGTTICSGVHPSSTNNIATCATATLGLGSHNITATYGADANFATSSNTLTQTVAIANATGLSLTSSSLPVSAPVSLVNENVSFTATITVPAGSTALSKGTVAFTDNGSANTICNITPTPTGTSSNGGTYVAICRDSALVAGSHVIKATYSGDPNFASSSSSITQTVNQSSSSLSLSGSPSVTIVAPTTVNGSVTFTATITTPSGPTGITGTVTITGPTTTGTNTLCTAQVVMQTAGSGVGTASCSTILTVAGANAISAKYSGDTNFTSSTGTWTQLVQDFGIGITPANSNSNALPAFTVTQGFTTSNDPFSPQTITLKPSTIQGFASSGLNVTCSVKAANVTSGGTVNAPLCTLSSSTLPIASAGSQQSLTITMDATPQNSNAATPGIYTVTLTGTDPTTSLVHTAAFTITVRAVATLTLTSGQTTNNTGTVNFVLPAGVSLTSFTCQSVAGTGITSTGVKPSNYGFGCSNWTPSTVPSKTSTQTAAVTFTITTNNQLTTGALVRHTNIFAAGLLGLPIFGLMGILCGRKSSRSIFFRLVAILVVGAVAFQALGCGGSFHQGTKQTQGGTTPPGTYYLQVQGTGTDAHGNTQTYEAVLQVNVTL